MANVKSLNIQGEMPFSVSHHEEITRFLGQMNQPCFGIRIKYDSERFVDQPKGGMLSLYRYTISGEEAVRHEWIKALMQAIVNCGGTVFSAQCRDMENDQTIIMEIPNRDENGGAKFKVVIDMAVLDMDDQFSEVDMVREIESLMTPIKRLTTVTPGRRTYKTRFELRPGFLRKA